jgi:DNA-directed RNA polymerase specialized sigma24 family protein
MSSVKDVRDIPTEGKNLIILATVDNLFHFRIFDGHGKVVVDTDERRLKEQAGRIDDLRKRLENLWPPHELTGSEKVQVIDAVTSIVDHTPESDRPIIGFISGLKAGDNTAYRKLDERYRDRLLKLAGGLLKFYDIPGAPITRSDIVQSAFKSFFIRAHRDLFPRLNDEVDLWKLLLTITFRKVKKLSRRPRMPNLGDILEQVASTKPSPEIDALMAEAVAHLLGLLPDEVHRQIALLKMAGYTIEQIARRLGLGTATVGRKLKRIRCIWKKYGEES